MDSTAIRPSAGAALRETPASVGQRLLWFLDHYRAGGAALNCPIVCRLDGPLDVARLRHAVSRLIARHEALRTTVERRGRQLWQVVHEASDAHGHIDLVDLSGDRDAETAALQAVDAELRTRIDPGGPPVRSTLWRVRDGRHLLCVNIHHLATDAWSGAIQARELRVLYEASHGMPPPLPPVGLQYADFTARQNEYLHGEAFERDLRFWRATLTGATFDSVPLAAPDQSQERRTGEARLAIDARDAALLGGMARTSKTTLFGLMLALYFATVHRMSGKRDVAVASLFANRMRSDVQNTVGFIANVVALRSIVLPGASVRAVQESVQRHLRDAFVHQACPVHLLPGEMTVREGRRVDETVFQMLPQALDRSRMSDVDVTMIAPEAIESRFDFEVTLLAERQALAVIVFWNRRRLDHGWVSEFLREYRASIEAALRHPDRAVV